MSVKDDDMEEKALTRVLVFGDCGAASQSHSGREGVSRS